MLNRPFSSFNTNVIDEKYQNSTPGTFCGQNVLLSQEQHNKVFNTLTTSIAGMPGWYSGQQHYNPNCPNAVTFTFQNQQPYCPPAPTYWQCPPNPAFQNLNQMQQMNALDLMQLQRFYNEPYHCKFHLDNQTSTSDLGSANLIRPDFCNLAGMLKSKLPYWLQSRPSRNHKKLTLHRVTAKLEGHVYENLDLDEQDHHRRVSFQMDQFKDASVQARLCCTCDDSHEEKSPKPKIRKKGTRKKTNSPSSSRSGSFTDFDNR